jgi:large subunit ribosomal protein L25
VNTPETYFIEIDIDGKKYKTILKDVQYHPVNDAPMHADFQQVFDDKKTTVKLPIELTGVSKGVVKGGKLRLVSRRLTVKGLPADLPESIKVDITNVDLGQSVKVKDVDVSGVEVLDAPNAVIIQVKMSRAAMANKAAAEAE